MSYQKWLGARERRTSRRATTHDSSFSSSVKLSISGTRDELLPVRVSRSEPGSRDKVAHGNEKKRLTIEGKSIQKKTKIKYGENIITIVCGRKTRPCQPPALDLSTPCGYCTLIVRGPPRFPSMPALIFSALRRKTFAPFQYGARIFLFSLDSFPAADTFV